MSDEPVGGPLVLRHASKRKSGTWGPDDYDVIDGYGRHIGRISKPRAGVPPDSPWEDTVLREILLRACAAHSRTRCLSCYDSLQQSGRQAVHKSWVLLRKGNDANCFSGP